MSYIFERNPRLWGKICAAAAKINMQIAGYYPDHRPAKEKYISPNIICMDEADYMAAVKECGSDYRVLRVEELLNKALANEPWLASYESALAYLRARDNIRHTK